VRGEYKASILGVGIACVNAGASIIKDNLQAGAILLFCGAVFIICAAWLFYEQMNQRIDKIESMIKAVMAQANYPSGIVGNVKWRVNLEGKKWNIIEDPVRRGIYTFEEVKNVGEEVGST